MRDISEKVEAAYMLAHQVRLQDLVYEIMNKFWYDENVTLKQIINDVHKKKEEYKNIIDGIE